MVTNTDEKKRITENIERILEESKFRFNSQKEAWSDIDKKIFLLLGFISLFLGFIITNNLFTIFEQEIPSIFKFSLIIGISLIFTSAFMLIGIIIPSEFKTSASETDLLKSMKKNKLFNAKFHLINIYIKMNLDNKKRINQRSNTLKTCIYLIILGLLFTIISKSYPLTKFLGSF